jgi:hypothetical protein
MLIKPLASLGAGQIAGRRHPRYLVPAAGDRMQEVAPVLKVDAYLLGIVIAITLAALIPDPRYAAAHQCNIVA